MADDPRTSPEVIRALLHGGGAEPPNAAARFVQVLLSGFGYDFHDARNVARSNDQLVRQRAAGLLGDAATALASTEGSFRTAHVPPSTREQPFPPAEIMAALRGVEALRRRVEQLGSSVLTLEAPAGDRVWARLRDEHALLERLLALDIGAVVRAHDVLEQARAISAQHVRERRLAAVEALLPPFEQTLSDRRALFAILV